MDRQSEKPAGRRPAAPVPDVTRSVWLGDMVVTCKTQRLANKLLPDTRGEDYAVLVVGTKG
jgi:hypothetical protein